jgi:DNA (cytosine-5)-methyltransferase 1
MCSDKPAPTITTQFYGFGNGRFGHPSQDRALSLREGAMLQGFPKDYQFVPDDKEISFKNVGRMIGNAVPVPLARALARAVRSHLAQLPAEVANVR